MPPVATEVRARFDRQALLAELRAQLGAAKVRAYPEDLIAYENDGSVFRAFADVIVFPESTEEVAAVVRACRRHGAPVVPRGSGTGLAGGAVPVTGGVLLVTAKMNRILEIDLDSRLAVVQPGVINIDLTQAVFADGYFFAPDPSSQVACSIGGNVANNSGGVHTLSYGVTTNHVLALTVVLPDGEVVTVGSRAPDAPGLDLPGLFVGSEGTLGIVTEITVRLMRQREAVRTFLAVYDTISAASQTVSDLIARGLVPQALEMMDDVTISAVEPAVGAGIPLDAGAALLIEIEGLADGLDTQEAVIRQVCQANGARWVRAASDAAERARLWAARKGAFGALGRLAPNYYVQDAVVPRSQLPRVMVAIRAIADRHGVRVANVFHAGDG
ncbi:MAG TPA: FAD-binding protein, partial [Bacillota bacterium]